jgi:WD40 repeat protein
MHRGYACSESFYPTIVQTGELLDTLKGHTSEITSLAFSPDGKQLASGSWDRSVRLWNAQTRQVTHILNGHSSAVMSLVFSQDGVRLFSSSDDGIRMWDSNNINPAIRLIVSWKSARLTAKLQPGSPAP